MKEDARQRATPLSSPSEKGDDLPPERHWLLKLRSSLWSQKSALIGVIILTIVVFTALLAPIIAPFDPAQQSLTQVMKPPMFQRDGHIYLMGTDHLGRDLFSRIIYGTQVSIIVGFFSVFFSGGIGLVVG
ncbi:MAG: ABC transporter permease, partial [Nitrospinaceae bacterium]|nr:ABC transporter permease [Nitrospinaceae bacterium]